MKHTYLLLVLILCSCLGTKLEYKSFSGRMKTEQPDGKEFILGIVENVVINKMVQPNPLVIIDGIVLDTEEVKKEQYSLLYKEDVQTIDVLDGEKAIPIYGDKGRNGLILVTRKVEKQEYLKYYIKRDMRHNSR